MIWGAPLRVTGGLRRAAQGGHHVAVKALELADTREAPSAIALWIGGIPQLARRPQAHSDLCDDIPCKNHGSLVKVKKVANLPLQSENLSRLMPHQSFHRRTWLHENVWYQKTLHGCLARVPQDSQYIKRIYIYAKGPSLKQGPCRWNKFGKLDKHRPTLQSVVNSNGGAPKR